MEELHEWLDQRYPQPVDAQLKADLDARHNVYDPLIKVTRAVWLKKGVVNALLAHSDLLTS